MLILFLIICVIVAFATSAIWTVQIAEFGNEYFIRRFMPMMGWEYLEVPQANRYSEGGYSAPYWWTGRNYTSVSIFKTIEEAEKGFKLYKSYRKPKVKKVKSIFNLK